jgi:hypothetical protein
VLAPDPGVIAYRGGEPGGEDWHCSCGRTLASSVHDGEIWEIAIRCPACSKVWLGPALPPGHPLPQPVVGFPPGTYRLADTIHGNPTTVLVTIEAAERRAREAGLNAVYGERPISSGGDLERLVDRTETMFAHVLPKIRADRVRKRDLPQHRLLELIESVYASAASFDAGTPTLDVPSVVELHATVETFERWSRDPAWAGAVASVRNQTDFAHNLMTLALASFFTDAGNGVALDQGAGGRSRTADLWIAPRVGLRFLVEVKVPEDLVRPRGPITADGAEKRVRRALNRAGTEPGDQLGPSSPGALAVGGFQLSEADLDQLEAAASALLERKGVLHPHIGAILIAGWGILVDDSRDGRTTLNATLTLRRSKNPSYKGDPPISGHVNPRLRPVEGEVREFRLP